MQKKTEKKEQPTHTHTHTVEKAHSLERWCCRVCQEKIKKMEEVCADALQKKKIKV
jgi:hypothetical protein